MFTEDDAIFEYGTADAVADGTFTDCKTIVNPQETGIGADVALSGGVMAIVNRAVENEKFSNDTIGVVWDILTVLRMEANRNLGKSHLTFRVIIFGAGRNRCWTFNSAIGPWSSKDPRPVITVYLPEED